MPTMANYGSAPYEESAFKTALRLLAAGAAGWGNVRPGSNFGEAFLASGGRAAIASQQAAQAAQEYAIRQEEIQRRREEDAMQAKFMEAQIANIGKEKPPPERKPDIHNMTPEEWQRYLERLREESKAKAYAKGQVSQPKPPAPPKPPKPREAVLKRIDLIRQADPNNPEHRARLQAIIANPATPEERDEALKKLEISPGYYRR